MWDGVGRLLRAATGFDFNANRLEEIADRIYILEMAFNARQGITREDDRLPQQPEVSRTPEGHEALRKHAEMLTEYYKAHGCSLDTGIPTRETLQSLGLSDVADELETNSPYPKWEGPPLWPLDKYPHGGKRF